MKSVKKGMTKNNAKGNSIPLQKPMEEALNCWQTVRFTGSTGTKYDIKTTDSRARWLNTQEGCTQTPSLSGVIVCSIVLADNWKDTGQELGGATPVLLHF